MVRNNTQSFGVGEGELIEIFYDLPLPMRLDRWLVSKRPEQSRASIQNLINSGLVLINYKIAKAKTPLKEGDNVQIWMPPPEPLVYLKPEKMDLNIQVMNIWELSVATLTILAVLLTAAVGKERYMD